MSSGDEAIATSSATTPSVVDERERRLQKRQKRKKELVDVVKQLRKDDIVQR